MLQNKKLGELTLDELNQFLKQVGLPELPYPSTKPMLQKDGEMDEELGVIASDTAPLSVFSDQPLAYVVGQMFRKMPIMSMLEMQEMMIINRAPDSKNRFMLVVGIPGAGKSEGAKTVADFTDTRGANAVDCGGRYLSDIFWEQVIDYGQAFKAALTDRIRSGLLSSSSTRTMKETFPEALTLDGDKIVDIDWDKTVTKRLLSKDPDKYESSYEATERVMGIAMTIAAFENIPTQTTNSVGMKRIPGIVKRWHDEGRFGILDEYTKAIQGSDDQLQTFLQYMNGEIDEVTLTNSMKVAGREETYSYTLRRSEMKAGFYIVGTGNNSSDGFSTHDLSKSAQSRMLVFEINKAQTADWAHRLSQFVTGLPLSTLYALFAHSANDDPEDFARTMQELRALGLPEEQQAAIPPHQLTFLQNWQKTHEAIQKLTNFYTFRERLIDPDSDLYDASDSKNQDNIEHILPEISAQYRDRCAMDFRKMFQDIGNAQKILPVTKPVTKESKLRLNLSALTRRPAEYTPPDAEAISAGFGTRLQDVILKSIAQTTRGRPKLRARLVRDAQMQGVLPGGVDADGNPIVTIASLLNQDDYSAIGGLEKINGLRDALAAHLKRANPAMKQKTSREILPRRQAIDAYQALQSLLQNPAEISPSEATLILPGKDLTDVFNVAVAVDPANAGTDPRVQALINEPLVTRDEFFESLQIAELSDRNMDAVWRNSISRLNLLPKEDKQSIAIAEGTDESKMGITTLMVCDPENPDKEIPVHVLRDTLRDKTLIATDSVDDTTRDALASRYTFVTFGEENAEKRVIDFIKDSLAHEARLLEHKKLDGYLLRAFMLRMRPMKKQQTLAQLMTQTDQSFMNAPIFLVRKPAA